MGLTFIDLFCGIGTIRMGMEQAGHKCVYSVEWDKHKRKIYSIIFGGEPEGADIRTVRHSDLPRADLWTFGAPCQDFSIAGKRAGMEGERSSLVLEIFRLIRETKEEDRPKYLIYENVKGMLSSNGGRDFLGILDQMASLGYDRIEYGLLNSKDFGVPQNRERVFTLGHLRGRGTRKIFPLTGNDSKASIETVGQVSNEGSQAVKVYGADGIFPTVCAGTHGYAMGNIIVKGMLDIAGQENIRRVYDTDGISPCLTTMEGGNRQPKIEVLYDFYNHNLKQDGICGTLTAGGNTTAFRCGSFGVMREQRVRRLTPKECWRLQGIPDQITDKVIQAGISDSQMYRGAGDACSVPVIYEIGRRLS